MTRLIRLRAPLNPLGMQCRLHSMTNYMAVSPENRNPQSGSLEPRKRRQSPATGTAGSQAAVFRGVGRREYCTATTRDNCTTTGTQHPKHGSRYNTRQARYLLPPSPTAKEPPGTSDLVPHIACGELRRPGRCKLPKPSAALWSDASSLIASSCLPLLTKANCNNCKNQHIALKDPTENRTTAAQPL